MEEGESLNQEVIAICNNMNLMNKIKGIHLSDITDATPLWS